MNKTSTGIYSTGDYSTGIHSTGDYSTGGWSTGDWSTGDYSTGVHSTGDYSTGHRSTGNRSTGRWSISDYSTGHFSTEDYTGFGAFDKPCTLEDWNKAKKPRFLYFTLTDWVDEKYMSDAEKKANPIYKTTGGYLKVYDYQEAWRRSFDAQGNIDEQIKQLEALPNFDYDKFVQISGIDYRKERTMSGKEIEVNIEGKIYKAVIK